jgi:PiT family inorganic phosphate transporter
LVWWSVSAGADSLAHRRNNAQKTIGMIWGWVWLTAMKFAAAVGDKSLHLRTIITYYLAIGDGTMFGVWRIVKTVGQRITKHKPVGGFCSETGGAISLFLATALGIPASNTNTIMGAIACVGSVQRASALRWGLAGNIVSARILITTATGLGDTLAYWQSNQIF